MRWQIKKLEDELAKYQRKYRDLENIFDKELLEKDEEISHLKVVVKNYFHNSRSQKIRSNAIKS